MRKVIISVAPTSAASTRIDPDAIAEDVIQSEKAGASMVHMHVRNAHGELTEDLTTYKQIVQKITAQSKIVIQASTGGVSNLTIEQRCAPLYYDKVETVSLNVGSANLGEAVYRNPIQDVKYCVKKIIENHKFPEIEVFELGMIHTVLQLDKEFGLKRPILFDIVLGNEGAAPATIDALCAMRSFLPRDALWGITHAGRKDDSIIAAAIAMGASLVRIGFEDSDVLSGNIKAKNNAELVKKVADIIRAIGLEVAAPSDVRELFRLN